MSQNHLLRVELADRSYEINIAHHASPEKVLELVRGKNILLVADSNTEKLFGEHYTNLLRQTAQKVTLHSFPAGEGSKHLSTVEGICRAACRFPRSSLSGSFYSRRPCSFLLALLQYHHKSSPKGRVKTFYKESCCASNEKTR